MTHIKAQPLTPDAFSPFGDVICAQTAPNSFLINNGNCRRYQALAQSDVGDKDGETILSIFRAKPFLLPCTISLMERHPLGSQAFMPLTAQRWLVIVARDEDGTPTQPMAFLCDANQGVQYAKNTWHAPLTPLDTEADFIVMDRIGNGNNLEEFYLPQPIIIET